jgi:cytochrome c-type biogenesis protein CcmH/NrfG
LPILKFLKLVDQVIDDLVQAAVDFPVDISILKVLGDAYMRIDKLEEALKTYTKAEDLLR